eukprot:jgi/Ulvmu1/12481/UM009_0134.1
MKQDTSLGEKPSPLLAVADRRFPSQLLAQHVFSRPSHRHPPWAGQQVSAAHACLLGVCSWPLGTGLGSINHDARVGHFRCCNHITRSMPKQPGQALTCITMQLTATL